MLIATPHTAQARATSWQNLAGVRDPLLGSAGSVGVTLPLINVGWSVSVSLTVYQSTLLRWMECVARLPVLPSVRASTPGDPAGTPPTPPKAHPDKDPDGENSATSAVSA